MLFNSDEKIFVLGASRGLGAAFVQEILAQTDEIELFTFSRKMTNVQFNDQENSKLKQNSCDLTNERDQQSILQMIYKEKPKRILYFAGGGPFGRFEKKQMKDHMWALELNFIFPMKLLHFCMQVEGVNALKQIIFVGSAVAENQPDLNASSYAASKHALRGLITTVQKEIHENKLGLDLRLFSPTYLDTALLPLGAWPRKQANLVKSPVLAAQELLKWIQNYDQFGQHLIFK